MPSRNFNRYQSPEPSKNTLEKVSTKEKEKKTEKRKEAKEQKHLLIPKGKDLNQLFDSIPYDLN